MHGWFRFTLSLNPLASDDGTHLLACMRTAPIIDFVPSSMVLNVVGNYAAAQHAQTVMMIGPPGSAKTQYGVQLVRSIGPFLNARYGVVIAPALSFHSPVSAALRSMFEDGCLVDALRDDLEDILNRLQAAIEGLGPARGFVVIFVDGELYRCSDLLGCAQPAIDNRCPADCITRLQTPTFNF